MIKDKEYPVTHSIWTAWFAINADDNVAIMECDDNGPAPLSAHREVESDILILETLTEPESKIAYTDQQLSLMMSKKESSHNDEHLNYFHISDYISHKRILEEGEYAHCFIDDFSDFKKNI